MSVISGVGGAVNTISTVRTWRINSEADLQAFVASNTKAGTGRLAGNKDWNGQYTAYGHTPIKMPGEAFAFVGNMSNGKGASGTAIVDSVEIVWDIEAGAPIAHTVSFSGNGALTLGAAAAADESVLTVLSSIGTKVELAPVLATPVYIELLDIRTITLTITASNQSYVSSSTAGETKRTEGNIDATLAISVYSDDFTLAPFPVVNDARHVRLFIDDTLFWDIDWMRFGENSDIEVDLEGPSNVGVTLNASFSAFEDIDTVLIEGFIKKPAGSTFWPKP